jgi:hypothetical protein
VIVNFNGNIKIPQVCAQKKTEKDYAVMAMNDCHNTNYV